MKIGAVYHKSRFSPRRKSSNCKLRSTRLDVPPMDFIPHNFPSLATLADSNSADPSYCPQIHLYSDYPEDREDFSSSSQSQTASSKSYTCSTDSPPSHVPSQKLPVSKLMHKIPSYSRQDENSTPHNLTAEHRHYRSQSPPYRLVHSQGTYGSRNVENKHFYQYHARRRQYRTPSTSECPHTSFTHANTCDFQAQPADFSFSERICSSRFPQKLSIDIRKRCNTHHKYCPTD